MKFPHPPYCFLLEGIRGHAIPVLSILDFFPSTDINPSPSPSTQLEILAEWNLTEFFDSGFLLFIIFTIRMISDCLICCYGWKFSTRFSWIKLHRPRDSENSFGCQMRRAGGDQWGLNGWGAFASINSAKLQTFTEVDPWEADRRLTENLALSRDSAPTVWCEPEAELCRTRGPCLHALQEHC